MKISKYTIRGRVSENRGGKLLFSLEVLTSKDDR